MTELTHCPTVRKSVAHLSASYFLVHLQAEVEKPDSVLLEDYPDMPVREMTRGWIERVRHEFSIPADEKLPSDNIFARWCDMNGKFQYHDSALFGYNRIYLPRLFDLRDGTPTSREAHYNAMRTTFDGFDYEKEGFT